MRKLILGAAAALTIAAPSASYATTTINIATYGFTFGSKVGAIHLAGSPFDNRAVNFGQFKLDGTNVTAGNSPMTFYTYCVDLYHALFVPGTFTIEPLSVSFGASKATNITKLLANVTPVNADESAAMQLAMWEVAFDTSASMNVQSGASQGLFYSTDSGGPTATTRTLANGYLANLSSWTTPTNGTAYLLYNATNQSQVFFVPGAVPESATWGMMIVGFGIVGATIRRRRQTYLLA